MGESGPQHSSERKLAAILFSDIVGYTALMGKDQSQALELVRISKDIQKPLVEKYHGTWLKEMGDGAMAKFNSALDAVHCAVEIQEMARAKLDAKLRIGVHLGDVTVENEDVYGDGVNVASRLESISDPGGIYISDAVEKAVRGQLTIQAKFLGELRLKNVDYGVRTYALQGTGLPVPEIGGEELKGHFIAEIRRRGVLRAGFAYLAIGIILSLVWKNAALIGLQLPDIPLKVIITVLALGFPFAMFLAWTFERSPEGFVRTSSKQSWRNPYTTGQRKPLTSNSMLVALLCLVIITMAVPGFVATPLESEPGTSKLEFYLGDKSIAVMPFENLSSDPEQEYFSDGISDDILNYLAKISELRVKSRTSTLQYKKTVKTAPEIGAELGVAYILEGTVRKSGNMVRIVAQLIETKTDNHLWSETYDKEITEVFAVQSEVAQEIANQLKVRLTSSEREELVKKAPDLEAYDFLLRAREVMKTGFGEVVLRNWNFYNWTPETRSMASVLLVEAIESDSTLAAAYMELARLQSGVASLVDPDSTLQLINRAIALDPSDAEAYVIRARMLFMTGDAQNAQKDLIRAIEIQPNNPKVLLAHAIAAHNTRQYDLASDLMIRSAQFEFASSDPNYLVRWGYVYWNAGDLGKAEELFIDAYDLDPTSVNAIFALKALNHENGNSAEMLRFAKMLNSFSDFLLFQDDVAWANYLEGNLAQAEKYWNQLRDRGSMHSRHRLAFVKAQLGKDEEAEGLLLEKMHDDSSRVMNGSGQGGLMYDLAVCNAYLGNKEEAYTWLERAVEDDIFVSAFGRWWMYNDPMLKNLDGEERFEQIRSGYMARNEEINRAYQKKLNELEASKELQDILR